jgi:transposase
VPEAESIGRLGVWEGYRVGTVERFEAEVKRPRAQVWIELHPDPARRKVGDHCGGEYRHIHDRSERWVRDLSVFDADTHLLVHRCGVACPRCGPSLERLSWLARYARVTTRLAESVARMCKVLPVKHVAEFYALKWDAVKAIDKAHLERTLKPYGSRDDHCFFLKIRAAFPGSVPGNAG